ncbi:MAG: hypothetical protein JEZ00_08405 [Anaerolineaceae bacterium]|nr:hypothetical protein [Anaerolineaceae bacterium]
MKTYVLILIAMIIALGLSACGGNASSAEMEVAVAVALTQTAEVPEVVVPSATTQEEVQPEPAILKGTVHLASPPTPEMIVYAFDPNTGQWATMQTDASDLAAPFELYVSPGSYMVFAYSLDGGTYLGSPRGDELDLALFEVSAGEIIENIDVRPPSQAECGLMWGVPPSPDGRFAGFMASEACMNMNWTDGDYLAPSAEFCQMLQRIAQDTLNVPFEFTMMEPFTDVITGESGSGCTFIATGDATQFEEPHDIVTQLTSAYIGWEENPQYQGGGPTGSLTAMTRDMALMLITAGWEPAEGIDCPDDQPIGLCPLTPEQKIYTVEINVGMK